MTGVRIPFALSLAGHAAFVAALMLLARLPPPPPAPLPSGITLILAPPPAPKPPPRAAPPARPAAPTPPAVRPPPKPPPMPRTILAPAPVAVPAPPRPRRKPVIRRPVRPLPRRMPPPARREPVMPRLPPPISAPPPIAPAVPAPPPAPGPAAPPQAAVITPGYRASLLEWLEAHKRYPAAARARGEEGSALLRFRIDRSGRVLDYAVVKSTGYRDLDAAVAEMMRGAILPAFPPAMPEQSLTILVPIRFSLQ